MSTIIIQPTDTIDQVLKQFMLIYDGLKFEFFTKTHRHGEGSHANELLPRTTCINELSKLAGPIEIDVSPDVTVAEMESAFDLHGLNIQVFRKMKSTWLETVQTDGYSLKQQMKLSTQSRS